MRIIFRTDANSTIGLGHLVRSLALADMVRPLAECWVAIQAPSSALHQLISDQQLPLWELPEQSVAVEAASFAARLRPTDVVVLDGYHFDFPYQQALAASGCRLVAIDDLHAWPMAADLIINHSPGIVPQMYLAPAHTRFCLGPEYSLLRAPFLTSARPPEQPAPIERVLLCFGGADPLQLSKRCLTILLQLPGLQSFGVLIGSAFQHTAALQSLTASFPNKQVQLYQNANADEMVRLFRYYHAIVCPASTILIESLLLGKAALTGYYAENQRPMATYVHQHRQAYSLGNFTALSDIDLQQALGKGMHALAHEIRRPYAQHPAPEKLRAEFQLLLSC